MRMLIPLLLLVLGLGAGAGTALLFSDAASEAATEPSSEDAPETDEDGGTPDAPAVASAQAMPVSVSPGSSADLEYVRLNNQFIVPIVRNEMVRSLVVLSLTLEVRAGQNEAVFDREPRIRDAFLRVLFAHANAGGFDGTFTASAAMSPLRQALREAARGILGNGVNDVLIVDIVRQDA